MIRRTISRRKFVTGAVTIAAVMPLLSRPSFANSKKLHVYNWDTYIGPTTIDDFSAATGTEVQYDLYADNAELFARLREGNPGYDVIVPTNDTLARMIKADMVVPLDHSRIPNIANLEERFQNPVYDPGCQHSVCYFWGTWGTGYRKSSFKDQVPDSWSYLFGPEAAARKGRIAWLSDPSAMFAAALKYNGFSLNSTNMEELKKAEETLRAAKGNVRTIAGDNGQDLLLSQEVDICIDANGDLKTVMLEDDDLNFVNAKEGVQVWQDTLAIAKGGKNIEGAHEFINYILEAQVHADIAKATGYALPNAAAKKLMPAEYLANPVIFPPEDVMAKSEPLQYLGEEISRFYADAMTRVRAD